MWYYKSITLFIFIFIFILILNLTGGGEGIPLNRKTYRNRAEDALAELLTSVGWEVTKKGWPDFACFRDGELILVEVKTGQSQYLKAGQRRLMNALSARGIDCYRWDSEGGFVLVKGGQMSGNDATLRARVSKAVDRELEKIAKETGRKKSDLIREAVTAYIGMYRHAGKT